MSRDQTIVSTGEAVVTTAVTLASRPRLLYDGAMALGLVSFVSLGPGDPALRAARAAARLAEADVVVRTGDGVTAEQLVALRRAGKRVVRAADGDALESVGVVAEVLAVARSGVPFEIVPGDRRTQRGGGVRGGRRTGRRAPRRTRWPARSSASLAEAVVTLVATWARRRSGSS